MLKYCCLTAVLFALTPAAVVAKDDALLAKEYESRALSALKQTVIKGAMTCEVHVVSDDFELFAEIDSSFDANRVRIQQRFRNSFGGFSDASSSWLASTYVVLADGIVMSRDASMKKSTWRENQSFYPDVYAAKRIFWPQFIGASSYSVWEMPDKSPRGFLEQNGREVKSVSKDEIDGMEVVRVDYRLKQGGDFIVWFSPKQNGLVRRVQYSAKSPSGVYDRVTNVELKEWAPKIWFPVRLENVETHGGVVLTREVTRILSFVPEAPAEDIFGMAGLAMPLGEVIADTTQGEIEYKQMRIGGIQPMTESEIRKAFPVVK